MSSGYSPAGGRQEMITLIRTAMERVQVLRQAEVYGPFVNRELVGEALAIPWHGDDRD